MSEEAEQENPLESLVELFVYAPIGLLYERQDVIPQLIKRGRSQVQLAKVVGQMALRQGAGSQGVTAQVGQLQVPVEALASVAAQLITEFGSAIGLAPPKIPATEPSDAQEGTDADAAPPDRDARDPASEPESLADNADATAPRSSGVRPRPVASDNMDRLPIARYAELTAREIIGLLDDLTPSQLERVERYETGHRARKTVLAKIARLRSEDG